MGTEEGAGLNQTFNVNIKKRGGLVTEEELIKNIENIRVCKSGDSRAPHKPLLLLYALAELQKDTHRLMLYNSVKNKLTDLLLEFGPSVKTRHSTLDPFLRLSNDNIWEVDKAIDINEASNKLLIDNNVRAGFNEEAYYMLKGNNRLIGKVTEILLEKHFTDTLHDDILARVGLNFTTLSIRKTRDPAFRERILSIYDYKCAICGFDLKLNNSPLALEAAHIKWHKIGGPNIEVNGLALCVMHHKLFDQGAFTFNSSKEVLISNKVFGATGFKEWLSEYEGKRIYLPTNPDYHPKETYIHWHVREVFKCDYAG